MDTHNCVFYFKKQHFWYQECIPNDDVIVDIHIFTSENQ